MALFLRQRWKRSPPYPVRVDRANSLAQGLFGLYGNFHGLSYDAAERFGNGTNTSLTREGDAAKFNGTTSSINIGNPGAFDSFGSDDFFVYFQGRFDSVGEATNSYETLITKDAASNRQLVLTLNPYGINNHGPGGIGSLGFVVATALDLSTMFNTITTDTDVVGTGGRYGIVAGRIGNALYLWINGISRALTSLASSSGPMATGGTAPLYIGRRAYVGFENYYKGTCEIAGFWKRTPTAALASELWNNPWQLFAPLPARRFFLSTGASNTVTVPLASITVAALAPTVSRGTATNPRLVTVPAAAITVAAPSPSVSRSTSGGVSVSVPVATVSVASLAPSVSRGTNTNPRLVTSPAASITVAGLAPTITQTRAVYVGVGTASVVVAAQAPTILIGGVVFVPPSSQGGAGGSKGRGGKRDRRRTIIEIDGEEYIVGSVGEAEQLLGQKKQALIDAAPAIAKKALNKARDIERKTGELPPLEITAPEINADDGASKTMVALVERAQRALDEQYLRAARDAELSLLARRSYMAQDEEDALAVLLLS